MVFHRGGFSVNLQLVVSTWDKSGQVPNPGVRYSQSLGIVRTPERGLEFQEGLLFQQKTGLLLRVWGGNWRQSGHMAGGREPNAPTLRLIPDSGCYFILCLHLVDELDNPEPADERLWPSELSGGCWIIFGSDVLVPTRPYGTFKGRTWHHCTWKCGFYNCFIIIGAFLISFNGVSYIINRIESSCLVARSKGLSFVKYHWERVI